MKFGVQLYGLLGSMKGSILDNLKALAAAEVEEIEPCISLEAIPGSEKFIWPADWLMAHEKELGELGLRIKSAHVFTADLAASVKPLLALAEKVGLRQYVVGSPRELTVLNLQQAALSYCKAADELGEAGVSLLIHNGAADIQTKISGKTAYEHLLDLCMGKVFAQVDVGWVKAGGEDPETILKRNAWRVRSLHHKDVPADGNGTEDISLGKGAVDLAACFGFAQHRNIPQLIDQDYFGPDAPKELADDFRLLNRFTYSSRKNTVSYLNIFDAETGEIKTLSRFDRVIEAPNWLKKSDRILFNSEGHMYAYDISSGKETLIDTGSCDDCNNDHVVSPDETELAVSHVDAAAGFGSRVYTLPITGGEPKLITPLSPSYLHGWSPDGKELAYCAFREIEGKFEVDIYAIPVEGGEEKRLTVGGFNDGPEYSPDGSCIWYNSTRSGLMQIWRMKRDGSEQTQLTRNERNNWFGHVSPDGKKVVYLSYAKDQLEPQEHLPNMPVELWMMNSDGKGQHRILSFFGGQGSLNVNSWASDSRHFAFVSYEAE